MNYAGDQKETSRKSILVVNTTKKVKINLVVSIFLCIFVLEL